MQLISELNMALNNRAEWHSQMSRAFPYSAEVHLFQDQLPTRQTGSRTLRIPDKKLLAHTGGNDVRSDIASRKTS